MFLIRESLRNQIADEGFEFDGEHLVGLVHGACFYPGKVAFLGFARIQWGREAQEGLWWISAVPVFALSVDVCFGKANRGWNARLVCMYASDADARTAFGCWNCLPKEAFHKFDWHSTQHLPQVPMTFKFLSNEQISVQIFFCTKSRIRPAVPTTICTSWCSRKISYIIWQHNTKHIITQWLIAFLRFCIVFIGILWFSWLLCTFRNEVPPVETIDWTPICLPSSITTPEIWIANSRLLFMTKPLKLHKKHIKFIHNI